MTAFVIHRGMEISDPVFCSLGEVGMHFTLLSHYCDAEYRGKKCRNIDFTDGLASRAGAFASIDWGK